MVTWCMNRLETPWAVGCHNGGALRRLIGQAGMCKKERRSTTPMQIRATLFVYPVAHTDAVSDGALARSGLTDLLQLRSVAKLIFEHPGTCRVAPSKR